MKTYIVKLKQAAVMTGIALGSVASGGAMTPASALTFDFRPVAGTSAEAIAGFNTAGARWSSLFTDNVTINIDINFTKLAANVLAQAGSTRQRYDYSRVYTALSGDRTSADDFTAVASLPTGSTFNMLLNRTTNSPNGSANATPYLDNNGNANNAKINISNANAKALGLILDSPAQVIWNFGEVARVAPDTASIDSGIITDVTLAPTLASVGSDAEITFSTDFVFDFDPSDGIASGAIDFVGVATHEIGHALGFTSGVDVLDTNSPPFNGPFNDSAFTFVNSLDLFRYSADSLAQGAIDWTADTRAKYLSFDGRTSIGALATGSNFGDGQQASHWKDSPNFITNPELGIMNPTFSRGQLGIITENDLRGFDVIGWNRVNATVATQVPEPSNIIGTLIFAGFGAKMVLKRRQKLAKSF
ncbi:NF038122 family metalloprotease [Chamaesiphon polymorphus]|uniref:PEP-CTERM sorting domain-containing protein n=1 Tax=Chamaesiphon polymorphus CCALA 037 TaxID=2107692 RepID=A0A2T1GIL2_9CYAN|nr:NF038122 family metalloprotease [Chamaesiphon polymorphus]PSB57566.1 PEP-CTERM sorting domain-containing protein [Chamaesiphon polymorphus CCALA 037]